MTENIYIKFREEYCSKCCGCNCEDDTHSKLGFGKIKEVSCEQIYKCAMVRLLLDKTKE